MIHYQISGNIQLLFHHCSQKYFGGNKLVKSARLLLLSIKSLNPIKLTLIIYLPTKFLISLGTCSTPKLIKCIAMSLLT